MGGVLDAYMAEDVHRRATDIGPVCPVVTYPLPKEEPEQHGMGFFVFGGERWNGVSNDE